MPSVIDAMDRKILVEIQKDASLSSFAIGEKVGCSSSPCWRRIKRMKNLGLIKQPVTRLSGKKLGLNLLALVEIKLKNLNNLTIKNFERAIECMPEVQSCFAIVGERDYMIRVMTRDMAGFDNFLRESLFQSADITEIKSHIALRLTKDTQAIPISLIQNS